MKLRLAKKIVKAIDPARMQAMEDGTDPYYRHAKRAIARVMNWVVRRRRKNEYDPFSKRSFYMRQAARIDHRVNDEMTDEKFEKWAKGNCREIKTS